MFDASNMEEALEFLIANSRPGGSTIKKLLKIQDQVRRNVFLGPKTHRYINDLVAKLDNIECQGLTRNGGCKFILERKRCSHKDRYSACERYQAVKAKIKGGPLGNGLGGNYE